MKTALTYLAALTCLLPLKAISQEALPPVPQQTVTQLLSAKPVKWEDQVIFFRDAERRARLSQLAIAALESLEANPVRPAPATEDDKRIITTYIYHVAGYYSDFAHRFLRTRYPLPPSKAYEVAKFINTKERYDTAKAAGFIFEGHDLLPQFRATVFSLMCKFKDYEAADAFQRAGVINAPLTPESVQLPQISPVEAHQNPRRHGTLRVPPERVDQPHAVADTQP